MVAHSGVSGTSQMASSSCRSLFIFGGDESVGVWGAKRSWEVGVKMGRSARFMGLGDRSAAGSSCFIGVGVVSMTGAACLATLGVAVFGGSHVRGSWGAAMSGVGPSGWYWMKTSGVTVCGGGGGPVGVAWPLIGRGISCGRLSCEAVSVGGSGCWTAIGSGLDGGKGVCFMTSVAAGFGGEAVDSFFARASFCCFVTSVIFLKPVVILSRSSPDLGVAA